MAIYFEGWESSIGGGDRFVREKYYNNVGEEGSKRRW